MATNLQIRAATADELPLLGDLIVDVYSKLDGFPNPAEQPAYYATLRNIGSFAEKPGTKILVAVTGATSDLVGGVVYFGDMTVYDPDQPKTNLRNTSGIRLLGVSEKFRGMGAGSALTQACIQQAREQGHAQVVLHTTQAMTSAWRLYESLGFKRSDDLDFVIGAMPIYGFRLPL